MRILLRTISFITAMTTKEKRNLRIPKRKKAFNQQSSFHAITPSLSLSCNCHRHVKDSIRLSLIVACWMTTLQHFEDHADIDAIAIVEGWLRRWFRRKQQRTICEFATEVYGCFSLPEPERLNPKRNQTLHSAPEHTICKYRVSLSFFSFVSTRMLEKPPRL